MLVSEILRIKGNTLFTTGARRSVIERSRVMAQHDIGSLVVMDHGKLAGMLTFREVLDALAKHGGTLGALKVSDIYERDPLTAAPGLDVMELRRTMLERHARYVPVMEGTTLQGVVSFHDVAKAVYEEQSFENRMLKSYIKDWPEPRKGGSSAAPLTPAAGTSPAACWYAAASTPRHCATGTHRDRLGRQASGRRPRARRVRGASVATSASSIAALRYGVSMKTCVRACARESASSSRRRVARSASRTGR